MTITYVTAFLHGERPKRSYDDYKSYFDALANTGISIVLFLDARSEWTFSDNVHVERIALHQTWAGTYIPENATLPAIRSEADTLEYIRIQNTKPEWVHRAWMLNPFNTQWFAWIDFGIVHVFRDPEATLKRLASLVPPDHPCIRIAGIWNQPKHILDHINWRFAGGFFLIHESKIQEFFVHSCWTIRNYLPRVMWEVNVWACMEMNGFLFEWYPSDHNDTIIPFTELFTE